MPKIKIMKKKYLTSLLTTELLSLAIFTWFFHVFIQVWPFTTAFLINSACAGYMVSRCIFKNNSARKQSAWLTTEWWAMIACQWMNHSIIAGQAIRGQDDYLKIGACSTGILVVYLITRGITKHNVNRSVIL